MTARIEQFRGTHCWLSNFYPSPVLLDKLMYSTVEHAYQAAKTTNKTEREWIRSAPSPAEAKRRGRHVYCRPDWNTARLTVMLELIRQKFSKEPLRSLLVSTGDAELIEGNLWGDTFWGMCRGEGENHLGKILMQVRQEIANAAGQTDVSDVPTT